MDGDALLQTLVARLDSRVNTLQASVKLPNPNEVQVMKHLLSTEAELILRLAADAIERAEWRARVAAAVHGSESEGTSARKSNTSPQFPAREENASIESHAMSCLKVLYEHVWRVSLGLTAEEALTIVRSAELAEKSEEEASPATEENTPLDRAVVRLCESEGKLMVYVTQGPEHFQRHEELLRLNELASAELEAALKLHGEDEEAMDDMIAGIEREAGRILDAHFQHEKSKVNEAPWNDAFFALSEAERLALVRSHVLHRVAGQAPAEP